MSIAQFVLPQGIESSRVECMRCESPGMHDSHRSFLVPVLVATVLAAFVSEIVAQEAVPSAGRQEPAKPSIPEPAAPMSSPADQGEFSAHGSGVVRIELEYKLKVPQEKTEQVWQWLQEHYSDCSWLVAGDHKFKAAFGDEGFTDRYFDTPDLKLLAEQSGVRHRSRIVHSGSADAKDGRQLLQIKLNRDDPSGLGRSEIKFLIGSPQTVTRKTKTVDDLHPMLGLVIKDERQLCKDQFIALGLDPYAMRPILTVTQNRRRVYLSDQWGAFATLTLDMCSTDSWGADLHWTEIELELNEIRYTEASAESRKEMERINSIVQKDLQQKFPDIVQDQTPKYNKAFLGIEATSQLPLRRLIAMGIDHSQFVYGAQATLLSAAGLIFCGVLWLFRGRWMSASTRAVEPVRQAIPKATPISDPAQAAATRGM